MPRSPQDIYARHLLSPRGYPLWTPEPSYEFLAYRRDGLRIGDIGVVIPEDGCFDVFFNLCLPHDHPFHQATGVPDNFRPIELDDTDVRTVINAENSGRIIATSSVKTVRTGERSGGSPSTRSGTRSTGLEYEFSLSSSEGALLILPEGAERRDLRNHHRFLEAATRHGADWYRFAEEKVGQIVGNDSLYLITGLYKTRSWSLAAFEKTAGSAEYPAQLKLPQVGGGDLAATCTWDTMRALDWRVGPVDNYGLPNQTVFIRGFKIAHRTGIFGTRWITVKADAPSTRPNPVKSIGAVPGDSWLAYMFGGLSTGSTAESSSSGARDEVAVDPTLDAARNEIQNNGALAVGEDVVIHRMPEASQAFHPSDIINSYLLDKEPSAKIAVTHDDEWITLLEKNLLRPEDLVQKGLLETLVSQNYDIFSEAGAVYLRSRRSDLGIFSATEAQDSISIMVPSPSGYPIAGQSATQTGTFNQHLPSGPSHIPNAPRFRSLSLSEEPLPDLLRPATCSPPTPTEVQVNSQRTMPSGAMYKRRHEPTDGSYVPDTPKIRQRSLSDEPHSDLRRPQTPVDSHPTHKHPAKPLKSILKGSKNAQTNDSYEPEGELLTSKKVARFSFKGSMNAQTNDSYEPEGELLAPKKAARVSFNVPNVLPPGSRLVPMKPPAFDLHWQLLPYDPRRSRRLLRFDVAFPANEIVFQDSGYRTKLTDAELNASAANGSMTRMRITFERVPFSWEMDVMNKNGICCRNVFEAIYETFNEQLTPEEQRLVRDRREVDGAFRLRCKLAPGIPEVERSLGWKRVDILLHQTIFLGLTQPKSGGDWVLNLGSLPHISGLS